MSNDKMIIHGGKPLTGEITVSGGKNTAVAVIPAAILSNDICTIENLPDIEDVHALIEILTYLGAQIEYVPHQYMKIDASGIKSYSVPYELTRKLRASYYLLGALLGRFGCAEIAYPGGCEIGSRPIDQHLKGFAAIGVEIDDRGGVIYAKSEEMVGNNVFMDVVTVGGTINVMIAAVKAIGITIIHNAAKEPHIVDLANFLNSMGAQIKGAGTDTIRIRGVEKLHGSSYTVIPDQIETGTLMIAAAATHGDVTIRGCIPTHMEALYAKLLEMGIRVIVDNDSIRICPQDKVGHRAVNIITQVYPGFPTDLQQPMTALLCCAKGTSSICETIFEHRFKHVDELRRMGAKISLVGCTALIEGVDQLYGAPVTCSDLRAGAALIVAGLMANGATEIYETSYIDRGYEKIEEKLRLLGADIHRQPI